LVKSSRGGTAFSQILLDVQMLPKLLENSHMDSILEDEEEGDLSRYDESTIKQSDPCSSTHFQMNMIMPNAGSVMEEDDIEINVV